MKPKRGHVPDDQLRGFLNNHFPSREYIERVRAAGIVAEDLWVQEFAETLLDMRKGIRGGRKYILVRHWNEDE